MEKCNFIRAFETMVGHEGGYSNRASDRGGMTWRGISRKNFPNWEGWKLIDNLIEPGDSDADINATLKLDAKLPELERVFYKENFWDVLKAELLPLTIASELFDTAVNQGAGTAAQYLQEAVNALNNNGSIYKDIKVDGGIGPVTLAAFDAVRIHYATRYGADAFNRTFVKVLDGFQFIRYQHIIVNDPSQEVNYFGWVNKRIGSHG